MNESQKPVCVAFLKITPIRSSSIWIHINNVAAFQMFSYIAVGQVFKMETMIHNKVIGEELSGA